MKWCSEKKKKKKKKKKKRGFGFDNMAYWLQSSIEVIAIGPILINILELLVGLIHQFGQNHSRA
jgi:hypothetical protein